MVQVRRSQNVGQVREQAGSFRVWRGWFSDAQLIAIAKAAIVAIMNHVILITDGLYPGIWCLLIG